MAGLRKRLAAQRARRRDADSKLKTFKEKIATQVVFLAQRPRLAALLAREFNLRFTSGWRSVARNKAVGGVPNSWHLRGTIAEPAAQDLVGTEANMQAASRWVRENVPNVAENMIHSVISGRHLHVAGWGVANWKHPAGGRLKRWRAGRDRQRARGKDAQQQIDRLKREIAEAKLSRSARGIDVSSHQGTVNYEKVKAAGYAFVWAKSSEGGDFKDSRFLANVKAAKAAGLKVGAYHYLRPKSGRNGAVEARFFHKQLQAAGLGDGSLRPVLDVEETALGNDATWKYARQALVELKRLTGVKPLFYTYPSFLGGAWPPDFDELADLWIAHYEVASPRLPPPWKTYAAWQHSSTAAVSGVSGHCDVNKTADLRALII